ncbi:42890_t:CDS:2 [Gigaspora margarita]|uniref:42890_t:CDS:1 n=1 Tax=Gigaspora margarita TaxID=4874 RepID=A0ABN7UR90_GIGMA|nr:42890_t:CDS:2 [Gigaspora margarita]
MNADNIFEIDNENSSFESQDILQDVSNDNITTTIATTSNDIYIATSISNNPITLNNKKSRSQPSPDSDKQSGQQCLTFIPEITISKQILKFAQKNKFNALIADIDLPSHETMKSTIQDSFIVMQNDIQTLFQKVSSKISITLDMWTSCTNMPFLCVMAHWIDNDWKLKKILLNIHMLPHPHTGEEIDEQLCDIFAAFDIITKILCATTNRGSNVILAMQLLKKNFVLQNNYFDFWSRCCLAHILNLIVTVGLIPIKSSIENVRNLVKAISSFSSITQDFRELGKSVGENEAISIIRYNKSLNKYKLLLHKEADLQTATQFLHPFYKTTNVLSRSTYTTLAATTQMSNKLQKYTDKIYNKTVFIAAILDPHIKLELIPADMNTEVNCAIFNNIFRSEYFVPILNNSSTNLETPLNLSYTEQVAYKRKTNTLTDRQMNLPNI